MSPTSGDDSSLARIASGFPASVSERPAIEKRRNEVLEFVTEGPFREGGSRIAGPLHELAPLELTRRGDPRSARDAHFEPAIDVLETQEGPVLFSLQGLLRARLRYPDELSDELLDRIDQAILQPDYWECCTENHQIMAGSAEYLVGALHPDREFADGRSGAAHRDRAKTVINRWLNWRAQLGFSEWFSNVYYDPVLIALLNVAEFAPNEFLQRRCLGVLDLMIIEFALQEFEGAFASTHGRTDAHMTLNPLNESTRPLAYLLWGAGSLEDRCWLSGTGFAVSSYRPPAIAQSIATDEGPREIRARHSIDVDEADHYDLDPTDPEDIMFFWGAHVWNHRDVIETTLDVAPEDHYLQDFATPAWEVYQEREAAGISPDPDPNKSAMTRMNAYTKTTPDWQLSCAQDYRKGRYGFQQHIWQATLSDRAVVYTTHPRNVEMKDRPDYWRGNAVMPRAAAHDGILWSLYRSDPETVETIPEGAVDLRPETFCEYTHAFVPRYAFDELTEIENWVLGRAGDGYIGLYSSGSTRWESLDETAIDKLSPPSVEEWSPGRCDLIADGYENVWLCVLGRRSTHGGFENFCETLTETPVTGDTEHVVYQSPDLGRIEFGWDRPLTVDGQSIDLDGYDRLATPYGTVPFGTTTYTFQTSEEEFHLSLSEQDD